MEPVHIGFHYAGLGGRGYVGGGAGAGARWGSCAGVLGAYNAHRPPSPFCNRPSPFTSMSFMHKIRMEIEAKTNCRRCFFLGKMATH